MSRDYLNVLKWFALVAMAMFHFSNGLIYGTPEYIVIIGRLAFPIFGFILGYNLAQAAANNNKEIESRMMRLLLIFGCFAQPFYWAYIYNPIPLNIMFTLALGVFITYRYKQISAWIVLAVFGLFVDYAWAGPVYVLASYFISRDIIKGNISADASMGFVASLVAVSLGVQSYYPLLALPLLALGLIWKFQFRLPRCKWFFYAFYPAHLALLQGILYLR